MTQPLNAAALARLRKRFEAIPERMKAAARREIEAEAEAMVAEMQKRMQDNVAAMQPDELMKTWTSFGLQAQDQFRRLMDAAVK